MATTGLPVAMASMMTIGSPSAKLGITSACARAIASRTPASASQPATVTREVRSRANAGLDLGPHRAVADKRQRQVGTLRHGVGDGVDQEQLAFLLDEPSDRDEMVSPFGNGSHEGKRAGSMPQCTTWIRSQTP